MQVLRLILVPMSIPVPGERLQGGSDVTKTDFSVKIVRTVYLKAKGE